MKLRYLEVNYYKMSFIEANYIEISSKAYDKRGKIINYLWETINFLKIYITFRN